MNDILLCSHIFPALVVGPFPSDLLESDSPDIYITSPTVTSSNSRFPPPLSISMNTQSLHTIHSHSPSSSPTTADFPHHQQSHQRTSLSRQHSFQHVAAYSRGEGTSPMSPSPISATMDLFDDSPGCEPAGRISTKRQRLSNDDDLGPAVDGLPAPSSLSSPGTATGPGFGSMGGPGKKPSRARSDSAPLGYGFGGLGGWQGGPGGRPRSGSGLAGRGVPNIGTMTRGNNGPPLLSIATVPSNVPNR